MATKIQIRREVHESEIIPTWYGIAYLRWECPVAVCYPIPLNLVIRFGRWLWYWLKKGAGIPDSNSNSYWRGYERGREEAAILYAKRSDEEKEEARKKGHAEAMEFIRTALKM